MEMVSTIAFNSNVGRNGEWVKNRATQFAFLLLTPREMFLLIGRVKFSMMCSTPPLQVAQK